MKKVCKKTCLKKTPVIYVWYLNEDKYKVSVDAVEDHFRQGPFVDRPVYEKKLL